MAKFIVELTKAFKVEAAEEDDAFEIVMNMDPNELEAAHEAAGCWSEVTAVYEAEDQDVDDDLNALNEEE